MKKIFSIMVVLSIHLPAALGSATVPAHWQTRAEASGFRATSDYDQTLAYLTRLDAASKTIHLTSFGVSETGRTLPLVVVARGIEPTPLASREASRAIVLLICGIHPGEVDGKDAIMLMLRDLVLGKHDALATASTILIVPIYNVDGHERISPLNRPTQNGPVEGMGFRTTTRGLDLNRDFMKLDSSEAQALIGLYNKWRPHLVVDNHVTNGSDHDWVLTYSHSEAPELPAPLANWLTATMPAVVAKTKAAGHPCGPYVSLQDRLDPGKGFDSTVSDPRFSSGYFPLRNTPTILIEMHAHKEFGRRVPANRDFLVALLEEIEKQPKALTEAVAAADDLVTDRGRVGAPPSDIAIRWKSAETGDTINFPVKRWRLVDSQVTGKKMIVFDPADSETITVPWIHRRSAGISASRPRGYLVLPGWPQIDRLINLHGLTAQRLDDAVRLDVETFRVADATFDESSYQGMVRVKGTITTAIETRDFPAGSWWIPAEQPDFELVVQLFEPQAPDSLFRWGLLNSALERKVWIGLSELEEFAREQLAHEELRNQWQQALEDESFKTNAGRRYQWWYKRTPHWDESVGLLPIMRVTTIPDGSPLESR